MPKYMRKDWFLGRLERAKEKATADADERARAGEHDAAELAMSYHQALQDVEAMLLRQGEPKDPNGYWRFP